ncbi:uncharacterized protein LOC134765551 [Penaeus indicus]|uniref:uncharacterized protein LOC134765551 n=1 Tax=Penaeus indicus TaxID=29960 RepID=UPI00300D9668
MEVPQLFVLVVALASASVAQHYGPPAPPPPPVSADAAGSPSLRKCKPGELVPGPTCSSFYMCVGSIGGSEYATRKVKFECAPGTVFSEGLGICVHAYGSNCLSGSSLPLPSLAPLPVPAPTPAPLPPPGPPAPVGPPAPAPAPVGPPTCPPYELDPTTVYECIEPGSFPSLADCSRFYKCIVTMDCIIKGFMFRCPKGYLFDTGVRRCHKEELVGMCDRVADAAGQSIVVKPVVELDPDSLDQFFEADFYWDFMTFLPNETQRIVSQPSSFSRGAAPSQLIRLGGN